MEQRQHFLSWGELKSTLFSLRTRDLIKGAVMAVGTPVIYFIQELIPHWEIDPIYKIALSAFVAYLIKNFFTDDVKNAQKIIVQAKEEAKEETKEEER